MPFSYKKIVFWAFAGFVFLILPIKPANALILTTWQNTCDDWHGKPITFVVRGETYPNYCDIDSAGYHFWKQFTDLDYTATSTFSTVNIYDTWHIWTVSKNENVPNVLYFDNDGNSHFLTGGTITNTFLADNTEVYLIKYDNFLYTPIRQVDIYGGGLNNWYFLVYTDQDLSYINSSDTLYYFIDYLSNFNAVYASSTPEQGLTLPAGTCDDLGTIAGSLCRVISYLFYPSQESLTQFSNLKDMVATKPPFGYFTSIKNYLNTLSSTTTPAFVLTAEIENITIFDTLKTALAWILWLFFAFWVIKRIGRFDF